MVFPIAGKSIKSFPATHDSSNVPAHPGGTIRFQQPHQDTISTSFISSSEKLSDLVPTLPVAFRSLPISLSRRRLRAPVTRSLLPNMTTRINDGASTCAVMRLGLAWITKWPRGLAFNQRTSFCHVAVSILTFMFC